MSQKRENSLLHHKLLKMNLPDQSIKEFQEIYEKEYGKKISWAEASDQANNLLELYKVLMDIELREQRRKLRLKDEPRGFHVDDGTYDCCVCRQGVTGDHSWYDKHGLKCMDCQKALEKHQIPASVCKNKDSWYAMWEFEYYFGVKSATIRKFVRQGKLKMRTVPREGGGTHLELLLIKDNIGVLPDKPKSHLVKTEDGFVHVEYEKVPFPLMEK